MPPLALDKLAITGSSEMVVQLLRRRLGRLAGPDPGVNAAAVNLGIDFRPGQARGKVKRGKWLQRLAKALKHGRRIKKVRKRLAHGHSRMSNIFSAGVAPCVGFWRVW